MDTPADESKESNVVIGGTRIHPGNGGTRNSRRQGHGIRYYHADTHPLWERTIAQASSLVLPGACIRQSVKASVVSSFSESENFTMPPPSRRARSPFTCSLECRKAPGCCCTSCSAFIHQRAMHESICHELLTER